MNKGENPSFDSPGVAQTSASDSADKTGDNKKVAAGNKDKASKTESKKKRSGIRGVTLVVLLLGVAIAAWSLLGKRVQPVLPEVEPSATNRVTSRLFSRPDTPPTTPKIPSSTPTKAPASSLHAIPSAALAAFENRLRTLEQARPAGENGEGLTMGAVEDLLVRFAHLEQLVAELPVVGADGMVNTAGDGGLTGALSGRIDDLEQRLVRAEGRGAGVQTALAFSLGQLRAAIVEGRPFNSDLDRVSALVAKVAGPTVTGQFGAGSPSARMTQAIDQLRGNSSQGIPTLVALQQGLSQSADSILRAAAQNPDSEWTDNLRARLSSVLRVRRTGEVEGIDPEAQLARAEARLHEGSLAAAYSEIIALEGAAQSAASGWLAAARARIEGLAGLESLEAGVADTLAAAARSTPSSADGR